jgi:hypothetical protein
MEPKAKWMEKVEAQGFSAVLGIIISSQIVYIGYFYGFMNTPIQALFEGVIISLVIHEILKLRGIEILFKRFLFATAGILSSIYVCLYLRNASSILYVFGFIPQKAETEQK